ncbi:MAG TPA: LysR substrate-binding domain-containing protein [Dermatophilaceae bacterium]|nr:LysR substrate-binding domain-containing protein [Dermatophilaceae bacterium]HQG12595.1 LysR substrate-binding domain-containing protein [Dermatophilaceae bacterium]HQH91835.1 LysR substrate-binding domain-containing protein [Dermatophilaceae bacterium]HQK60689.1 LysR substrate-binding domain-containing protein [Dermatophilaceae bacterium]
MDTEVLRWFQQVADGATVTEVADLWMVSQPKVSRDLMALQREVGAPLLVKSGRVLRLTHAGAVFKRHADAIVNRLDDALAAVDQLVDPERGTVTLAYERTLGTWLVPSLVGEFLAVHPQVSFTLVVGGEDLAVLDEGRVDLAVLASRPNAPLFGGAREGGGASEASVRWEPLFREPLFLAVGPGHRFEDIETVPLAELADEPWVVLPPGMVIRSALDQLCHGAGFEPKVAFECDDLATVRGFVGAGLGVSIVPAMGEDPLPRYAAAPRLVALADAGARREVGLAWSSQRRLLPAAELFRTFVLRSSGAGRTLTS